MIRSEFQERAGSDATGERRLALAIVIVLRVLSLAYLGLSIWIWARTIGIWPQSAFQFDTMNAASKVYHAMMCVLLPVTAVGLWTTLSWGRVVWFLAIIVEIGAYTLFSDRILLRYELLSFHIFGVAVFLSLLTGLHLITNDE